MRGCVRTCAVLRCVRTCTCARCTERVLNCTVLWRVKGVVWRRREIGVGGRAEDRGQKGSKVGRCLQIFSANLLCSALQYFEGCSAVQCSVSVSAIMTMAQPVTID